MTTTTTTTTYSKGEIDSMPYRDLLKRCSEAGLTTKGKSEFLRDQFHEWNEKQRRSYTKEKILAMPYRDIQIECRNAGLAAVGSTDALRLRLLDWIQQEQHKAENSNEEEQPPPAKKPKKDPADDLICPITRELPWCPVYADDGILYEKTAIEKHFETKRKAHEQIKSPITHQVLPSTRLVPAPQIKNLIETLIVNGSITGPLAETWLTLEKQKKDMEDSIKKAEQGDVKKMLRVARKYRDGSDGFPLDPHKAYSWFEKAAMIGGCVVSMSIMGAFLMKGFGVTSDTKTGLMYLTLAAGRGSDFAAFHLGEILAAGKYGIPPNKVEAKRLLRESLSHSCRYRHMSTSLRSNAQQLLNELDQPQPLRLAAVRTNSNESQT